jgi:RIO-like serine/threonine protein kinase
VHGVVGVPQLIAFDGQVLQRQWLAGEPMYVARPRDAEFYRLALRIVTQLHRHGVAHNDLAKEPNWLVLENGTPGLVDFQLASYHGQRGRWFRTLAREDLRHLLKHKRYYLPDRLTQRQRSILDTPGWPSRIWRRWGKPVYLFITRRLFGWSDREGAEDRGRPGAV